MVKHLTNSLIKRLNRVMDKRVSIILAVLRVLGERASSSYSSVLVVLVFYSSSVLGVKRKE